VSTSGEARQHPLTSLTPTSLSAVSEWQPRDAVARIRSALAAHHVVVIPSAPMNQSEAWWDVQPETGDTRAVSELGLNGGQTGPYTRAMVRNPFTIVKKVQQNPMGGQKMHDLTPRAEKVATRNQSFHDEIAKRNADNPNRFSEPQQRGGGIEYAVVLIVGVIAKVAVWAMSAYLLVKLLDEIDELVKWLASGGFARMIE